MWKKMGAGVSCSCAGDPIMSAFPPERVDEPHQSPWDAWCRQLDNDGKKEYTFTPEEYIDFYIRIEREMNNEKPGKDGNAGDSLTLKS